MIIGLGTVRPIDFGVPPTGDCAIGLEQGVDFPPLRGIAIGSVVTCIRCPKSTTGSDCSDVSSFGCDSVNSVPCNVDRLVEVL